MKKWSLRYRYTEANLKRFILTSPGVYSLYYIYSGQYSVFYVAQAKNIARCLQKHLSNFELNKCIKGYLKDYVCYFRYYVTDDENEQDEIVRTEIKKWIPACNIGVQTKVLKY